MQDFCCSSYNHDAKACYCQCSLFSQGSCFSFRRETLLSLDGLFDAIGYLINSFVNISPADWEFAKPYWLPVVRQRIEKEG